MRKFLEKTLAGYAKKALAREKPFVVGITGSVGKSSAKQAVACVLGARFRVRSSPRNYNTEIGLPLAVLALPSGDSSPFKWLGVLWRGWKAATFADKEFPNALVLEMGADRPGDIGRLCDIAAPDMGVVVTVGESHLEHFGSVEGIEKEKRTLVERLTKDGIAVLNRDDERVWNMKTRTKAKVVSFGFHEEADVRALEPVGYACAFDKECGMHLKIAAGGSTVPVFLPGVLGRQAVYAALAGVAAGLERGMNLVEISDALRHFYAPPGRMRYVAGIKRTVVIDDTYNAAPRSLDAALAVLGEIPIAENAKRIAVLGDMLELGPMTETAHREAGRKAASHADMLVLVGERMSDAEKGAIEAGAGEERVFHFSTPEEAGRFVQERMKKDDVILVKGSRGMHMEKVVKEIMADPLSAGALLVKEHDEWKW